MTFSLLKKGYIKHSTKSKNVTEATIYCACYISTRSSHGIPTELVIYNINNMLRITYMAMRTLDRTLEGTTSLSRDTATGIKPPGEGERKKERREGGREKRGRERGE